MVNLSSQMEVSLIFVLLQVCNNGCYSQDARVPLVNPREGLFALCAFFPSSLQKEVLWLVDTYSPKESRKKPFC